MLARDRERMHHHHLLSSEALRIKINIVNYIFPKNTRRKNAFLAVRYNLNKDISLHKINELAIDGVLIGPGNSGLDKIFKPF